MQVRWKKWTKNTERKTAKLPRNLKLFSSLAGVRVLTQLGGIKHVTRSTARRQYQ